MATEDFTTYSKLDANSRYTIIPSKITATDLPSTEDAYVYKDKGVNYFDGDFVHFLTVRMTAATDGGRFYFWVLANAIDDTQGIEDASGDFLGCEFYYGAPNYTIHLDECYGGTRITDSYVISLNTTYYLKIVRDESAGTYGKLYCYIYSDSERTNLLDTLTRSLHVSKKDYRYIYGANNRNSGIGGRTCSGYAENLSFETVPVVAGAASVTTQAVSDIDKTTATGNGNVTSLGIPAATQHGHCWATYTNPTTAHDKTQNGAPSATGAYTSNLTGLIPYTKYYVRAYITNSVGTFYGAEVTLITLADVPVVATDSVEFIAATTVLGHGAIINGGGSAVTQHGVCWSTSANPTTADDKTEEGATILIGEFFSLLTGLAAGITYHVRAYAVNSSGTGYGVDVTFITQVAGAPIVTTQNATDILITTVTGNGTIVDVGASAITQHGHCWGTTVNPTTSGFKTTKGASLTGAFASAITGLVAGTAYYIRAYATNSYGTSYGNNILVPPRDGTRGSIAVKGEFLVYASKSGVQRALLGESF